jgi:hypothetical protein
MTAAPLAAAGMKGPQNAGRFRFGRDESGYLQALSTYGESSCDLRRTTLSRRAASAFMAAP